MTNNSKRVLSILFPWGILTIVFWLCIPLFHASAAYFIKAFSITAALVMLIMYTAVSGDRAGKAISVTISLSSIALKLMASTGIFIYYFLKIAPAESPWPALKVGGVVYLSYTFLVSWYGLYWGGSTTKRA